MRHLVVILVLLGWAATARADTQAAHSVQSSQSAQGTQGTQNAQIFGLPPLPVALVAAGALLQKIHSPIKLNTQVITDQPAQQTAPTASTTASADAVYYGQAAAGNDDTQQLYVSGNQPVSGGGNNPSVPPGVTSWIQNPDGTITPLKWEQPDAQATADGSSRVTVVGDSQVPSTPQEGQVVSGTIIAGATVPMQQSFTGGSFNYSGPMLQQNVTYSTPDNTQDSDQVVTGPTPMMVAMPVAQPQQQQQQQVWMPATQGTQMMQGYYLPGQAKGAQVVQGYYGPSQAGVAVSTTVGATPWTGGQGKRGWGVRKPQGQGWGSGGMRPAGMMMPAGGMGQMQMQGPMGQGYMGQMQGPMGQGNMGQMQGMEPVPGQGGMMAGGPRPMGPGSMGQDQMGMGQGQMGGPAPGSSSGSSTPDDSSTSSSSADDGSAQGQTGLVGNTQRPAVMEPTVVIVDNTRPNGNNGQQPTRVTVTPPQGQPGPGSSGPGAGPGPSMGQQPGPAGGAGGIRRRPPAMVPVNDPQQGADGVMTGSGAGGGGMDGGDNMNN